MKLHFETENQLDEHLEISSKGCIIAVALALVFVSSLLIGYYFVSRLPPEGYSTIYLLNYPQKKAMNYPEILVINENNTFNVWVVIENHMGTTQSYEIMQKTVTTMVTSFPVEAAVENRYAQTIESGEIWETLATVSIDKPGIYAVIFELWLDNEEGERYFSYNYCVLNIEVKDKI
jgi:uncharacterized membrane protein